MSTGKRLAKRSIIGTRVCAPGEDGKFYSGVIHAVKTSSSGENLRINNDTRYSVRFDPLPSKQKFVCNPGREYRDTELVGPGFRSITGLNLLPGQRVYLTYNGREISGEVSEHRPHLDEVVLNILPPGHEEYVEVKKRLDEVRLLESRKSARLMDQDTDFARLADMAGDRKRASSHSIDVPTVQGSRKRRPSTSQDDKEDFMDECTAALVLMSLSCSPHSPKLQSHGISWSEHLSPSPGSDACSWRSSTPSPPLSESGNSTSTFWSQVTTDEGIVIDEYDDLPKKKKASRLVFQCTFPGCLVITTNCTTIEAHVRKAHLGPRNDSDLSDHEEEFYYTELELGLNASSPPTLTHQDMARPPHEDPEYFKQQKGRNFAAPINIPTGTVSASSAATLPNSPQKHLRLNSRPGHGGNGTPMLSFSAPNKLPGSPTRKARGETKKCRKVYGMEHRELWCTQCKWKKACTRFGD